MKWINTQEFVLILKRFPNKQIEASAYLGFNVTSVHRWKYSSDTNRFMHTISNVSKTYSEIEFLRLYGNQHWMVKPFFSLKDDHEKQLAIRMVEELIMLGRMEDIICENEVNNVRVCEHCHHLMNEGWLVDDIRTFCSNECLLNTFPKVNIAELQANAIDENNSAYWTVWEG